MGKRSKTGNKEDDNINIKEKKIKKKETELDLPAINEDSKKITVSVSDDNETHIMSKNEDKCLTKKKSKRKHNQSLNDDKTPNKKILFDDNAKKKLTVSEDNENPIFSNNENMCITKKKTNIKHKQSLAHGSTPNKRIIFDDNAEALEVPINKKKKGNKKGIEPKEDEPTEEDIDQFCDEINEEDNIEYENWVQLIEAKLSSNKKKT